MVNKCMECGKVFDPFDNQHIEHAVKLLVPSSDLLEKNIRAFVDPVGHTEPAVFCGAPCLYKFANPDTA